MRKYGSNSFYEALFSNLNKCAIGEIASPLLNMAKKESIYLFLEICILMLSASPNTLTFEDEDLDEIATQWCESIQNLGSIAISTNLTIDTKLKIELQSIFIRISNGEVNNVSLNWLKNRIEEEIWTAKIRI